MTQTQTLTKICDTARAMLTSAEKTARVLTGIADPVVTIEVCIDFLHVSGQE